MRSAKAIAVLGSILVALGSSPGRAEPEMSIDAWKVIGSADSKMVTLRTLAPQSESNTNGSQMAIEYRFKQVGRDLGIREALEMKKQGFLRRCASATASVPESHMIGGYHALLVRLDCAATKKHGTPETILMSAWIEGYDLQTKEVLFRFVPSDAEVEMAKSFLTRPAAASIPKM